MQTSLSGVEQCLRLPLGGGHVLELHHWRGGSARNRLSGTGWTVRRGQHGVTVCYWLAQYYLDTNIVSLTKFHINQSLLWSLLLGPKIRKAQLAVQDQRQPHLWQPRHGLPHQWPQARWRESHYERHHCGICRGQWGNYLQKISDNMTPLWNFGKCKKCPFKQMFGVILTLKLWIASVSQKCFVSWC